VLFNYRNQSILVYSQTGDVDAPKTAAELKNKGFYKVYLLLAGLNDLLTRPGSNFVLENPSPYHIISSSTALSLLKNNPQLTIYDTRPPIEFENKATAEEYYKNLGNIKNAINLEEKNFGSNNYPADKDAIILVYGRGESYKLARKLCQDGYRNVYVLRNFYDFVSSAFNVEGSREALQYLVNHEGLY
jgi:rhodanese-related sulfurtransferase